MPTPCYLHVICVHILVCRTNKVEFVTSRFLHAKTKVFANVSLYICATFVTIVLYLSMNCNSSGTIPFLVLKKNNSALFSFSTKLPTPIYFVKMCEESCPSGFGKANALSGGYILPSHMS